MLLQLVARQLIDVGRRHARLRDQGFTPYYWTLFAECMTQQAFQWGTKQVLVSSCKVSMSFDVAATQQQYTRGVDEIVHIHSALFARGLSFASASRQCKRADWFVLFRRARKSIIYHQSLRLRTQPCAPLRCVDIPNRRRRPNRRTMPSAHSLLVPVTHRQRSLLNRVIT